MLGFVKALKTDSMVVKNQCYPIVDIENTTISFIVNNEECIISIFDKNFEIFSEKA